MHNILTTASSNGTFIVSLSPLWARIIMEQAVRAYTAAHHLARCHRNV